MRRTLLTLALGGLATLLLTSDVLAQRRGVVVGGGRGGVVIGYGSGYGGYGGYGRGYGYSPYGYGNSPYGYGYSGYGYRPGISLSIGSGYYGSGYYGSPGYVMGSGYSVPAYTYGGATYQEPYYSGQVTQSFYGGPQSSTAVTLRVEVPTPDAQVWFGDTATSQQGTTRVFQSPPLDPNKNYQYTLKARWMENGKMVTRERQVNVQAGQEYTVNFRDFYRDNAPRSDVNPPKTDILPKPANPPLNPNNPPRTDTPPNPGNNPPGTTNPNPATNPNPPVRVPGTNPNDNPPDRPPQ